MKAQRALRLTTLLLPALLAWIVLVGEANRGFDRSARVEMGATAEAIAGTSYSGPELRLVSDVFAPQDVDTKKFPPGSEVLLRYRRTDHGWAFAEVREPKKPVWSESELDVPARVERAKYGGGISAVPLVPNQFAIPERTVSRIRGGARLTLILRRGAQGSIWVESATQTGDSLGHVVALLPDPRGGGPLVIGTAESRLGFGEFAAGRPSGWVARIVDLALADPTEIPGSPVDAMRLADGRVLLALASAGSRGFDVSILGPDGKALGAPRHFDGGLQTLGLDGSLWVREGPNADVVRGPGLLTRRDLAGAVMNQVAVDNPWGVCGAVGDVIAMRDPAAVVRLRVGGGSAFETDRWALKDVVDARLTAAADIVAASERGVFRLTAGVKEPAILFVPDAGQLATRVFADEAENVLIVTRPAQEVRGNRMTSGWTEHVFFIPAGGAVIDLGEIKDSQRMYAAGSWQEGPHLASRRFLLGGALIFYSAGGKIFVFDPASKSIRARILQRPGGAPERIL